MRKLLKIVKYQKLKEGNSGPSSSSKQKRETQAEPLSKKKEIVLTGDSMGNGFSEKSFSVNHKVNIVNFPGVTSEKLLEKLDVIIKEKPDDLIAHVGTKKNRHRHLSHFHLSLTAKAR